MAGDVADYQIRSAVADDVAAIVAMLADDPLGATRETPGDLAAYHRAFQAIAADRNQLLVVAEREGTVVGTLQLTFIPG
ncbi:MAG: GNAT family N-acetyltransferase, partial [Micromonosporaceae bacterium]